MTEPNIEGLDPGERTALAELAIEGERCPTCHARPGARCVSKAGKPYNILNTHRSRLKLKWAKIRSASKQEGTQPVNEDVEAAIQGEPLSEYGELKLAEHQTRDRIARIERMRGGLELAYSLASGKGAFFWDLARLIVDEDLDERLLGKS